MAGTSSAQPGQPPEPPNSGRSVSTPQSSTFSIATLSSRSLVSRNQKLLFINSRTCRRISIHPAWLRRGRAMPGSARSARRIWLLRRHWSVPNALSLKALLSPTPQDYDPTPRRQLLMSLRHQLSQNLKHWSLAAPSRDLSFDMEGSMDQIPGLQLHRAKHPCTSMRPPTRLVEPSPAEVLGSTT